MAEEKVEGLDDNNTSGRGGAPTLPVAMVVQAYLTHWVELPDGGMMLQITPAFPGPGGRGLFFMPPMIQLMMSAKQWEQLQDEVARGGRKAPEIEVAQAIPNVGV